MSCLPDIFIPSKSQPLPPHKVGGQFSLHLRSNHFQRKPSANQQKRYRSWMDTDRSQGPVKRSSRSYFYKERDHSERAV